MTAGLNILSDQWKRLWVLTLAVLFAIALQNTLTAQSDDILDRFTLSERNGIVQLDWTISAGNTCNGIGVLRSTDSVNFEAIGKINGVCGSLTEAVSYTWTDEAPVSNRVNYYRLELGEIGFSPVISSLIVDYQQRNYQIRPNPLPGTGQLLFENEARETHTLSIYQPNGALVTQLTTRSELFDIDLRAHPAGVYYFDLRDTGDRSVASGQILAVGR